MVEFVLIALLAAVAVWAASELRRRQLIHQLQQTAARHGYIADPRPRPLPRGFDIPGATGSSPADLLLTDPASGATAFRHRYRSGRSGNNQSTHEHLHVLVPLPFNAPHVLLRHPTLANRLGTRIGLADTEVADHALTRRLGLVDVEVGNEAFDRVWQVATDDERFARRLAADHTGTELVRRAQFQATPLRYEFFGPWVLVSGPDHTLDDAALLLGWQRRLAGIFRPDLATDYPVPAGDASPWR